MIISVLSDVDDKSVTTTSSAKDEVECNERDVEMEDSRRISVLETRESISAAMESSFEFLSGIVQITAVDVLCAALGSHDLQQKLSLLLCRCTSSCSGSIAISSVMLVGLLAQRDGQYREQFDSGGEPNDSRLIQPRINALLTNALLRVIEAHNMSVVSEAGGYEQLSTVDAALSAIIDLHTSDDPELLQNFVRLQTLKKLTECVSRFQAALLAAEDEPTTKDSERMMVGDDEDNDGGERDRQELLNDFKDTISNVTSFIEYKTLYCKNC